MKKTIQQKGLYLPQMEKDSCGVGLIADLKAIPSRYIVDSAMTILENMKHRGASGFESNTGDGAGILTQIPHELFKKIFVKKSKILPPKGKYGVGMFFFSKDPVIYQQCYQIIEKKCKAFDFKIILERTVPTDNKQLGKSAIDTEPTIVQLVFQSTAFNNKDIENRFYFLRNTILQEIFIVLPDLFDTFYIASLSSKTIVYKGMLTAMQLRNYFTDLQSSDFKSAVAIVHSRFSTNTLPKWKLAQPFRCIAHNGEINTIKGNLNWWKARENNMSKIKNGRPDLLNILPVCDPTISDSGNFDNVVDFLLRASRSIPHTMMMMIPESWQNDKEMPAHKKAFYQYHDAIMEPWDGPASICFTDGTILGATLDRNGLRPSRYLLTKNNILILGSEAGCLDIPASEIEYKSRLEPGKILVADLDEQRIISDEEVKEIICKRKPYGKWLKKNAREISDLPNVQRKIEPSKINLKTRQIAFGFNKEDEQMILNVMSEKSKGPVGSMGSDIPLAILSKIAQHPANYFKQQFAQVTNPPIDPIREAFYMSIKTTIGAGSRIIGVGEAESKTIRFDSPVLDQKQLEKIIFSDDPALECHTIAITYRNTKSLQEAILNICNEAEFKVRQGIKFLRLTDRFIDKYNVNIPSLLITGAIHHHLINVGLRKETGIIIDAGDIWESHHFACLLSYGADLICPHLALETCRSRRSKNVRSTQHYITAVNKGLLKIMSKLGISTLNSYKGAQTFEALGIGKEVIDLCFKNTVSQIGGLGFEELQKENAVKHNAAFNEQINRLPDLGNYRWTQNGEYHLFNPQTIHLLQHASKTNRFEVYQQFSEQLNELEYNSGTLRSFIKIRPHGTSIPVETVEPIEDILKRFATGAMSFGSISHEAHTALARAMNAIGGKSNSGEGGEDSARFIPLKNGTSERSAIKQVASGRFGVTSYYLTNADEIQIKMAQGAKPGEGGQLPGHKVNPIIAKVRHATPYVGLISPPPHHDIYSIEDLAQLIFDLKNANRKARISVKLVSKAGVGVIASGVAKAHADHILISGSDGGTGASPLGSIRHAGLPWELGLSETHQSLVLNGLRDRVTLQVDGQIRTGRDIAIATMLGAEEWGIATAALVVQGCILMRKCHLNTCPVGIATQDAELRKKFDGDSQHLINYFTFLAMELRMIMAELGVRTIPELVGRTDLLKIHRLNRHWKTKNLNLENILFQQKNKYHTDLYCTKKQDHEIAEILDRKLIARSTLALNHNKSYASIFPVKNTDRAVGTMLSHEISKRYGDKKLAEDSFSFRFCGSAGQSFGAFTTSGIKFELVGEANDGFGKGLSGAHLSVRPDPESTFQPAENIIIGNVALYGATAGEVYINGIAGDRFAVRNSGAVAVVEGIGHNGCEYMTGGTVVILGSIGKNFGAGMSGGLVYLLEENSQKINQSNLMIEDVSDSDNQLIRKLIRNHVNNTGAPLGLKILSHWENYAQKFVKIIPKEYKLALQKLNYQEQSKLA